MNYSHINQLFRGLRDIFDQYGVAVWHDITEPYVERFERAAAEGGEVALDVYRDFISEFCVGTMGSLWDLAISPGNEDKVTEETRLPADKRLVDARGELYVAMCEALGRDPHGPKY